jgi:uncharacterized protein involved in exopolysaccharide biosynthesis/Mrp family chromosome partitioning ATPase
MTPSVHSSNNGAGQAQGAGMSLDDVLFTLFRHKRLLIGFLLLGLAGAATVRLVKPPLYVSKAKLMVHYVLENRGVNPQSPDSQNVRPVDAGAEAIIAAEVEIFTSGDVPPRAVEMVGAEKILAKMGGGSNRLKAAGVVAKGIEVEKPHGSIITVSFRHRDPEVAPVVLDALIHAYTQKNLAVYEGVGVLDEAYRQELEQSRKKLAQTEEQLKVLKHQANVLFLDDTKHSYQEQIDKAQTDLLDATRELEEQKAMTMQGGSSSSPGGTGSTNALSSAVPAETLSDYSEIVTQLETLKRTQREMLLSYKEAHPLVQTVRSQIEKLSKQKSALEAEFPSLAQLALGSGQGTTNALGGTVGGQLAEIRRLEARVGALKMILTNIQAQASQVMDLEPKIAEVQRRRDEEQKTYEFALKRLERIQNNASTANGEANSISIVQSPTLPALDRKKTLKYAGAVFAGCLALGLGLAFLLDLVLDRSIKRASDVERHLRLPVFLTIPDTTWGRKLGLTKWRAKERPKAAASNGNGEAATEVALWEPGHQMHDYVEGLRERLVTYFEVNNLNLKKPKLVAVTGCAEGAGVSTLATGLAATLSKTGDGNVLLVDMNGDKGIAHSFYQGKPGCGLSNALEPEARAEAQVQENLYLASLQDGPNQSLAKSMSPRFAHLMPKLKASDYDYIIFDMPPVAPGSATPRLGSYMDIVLLVLEAEKTGQHSAARAGALMRESRANVAAVLNKHRSHVPAGMAHDS